MVVPTFLPPEGGDRPTIGALPGTGARPPNGWHSFLLASLPREGAVNPTCNFVGVLGHQRGQLQSGGGRESLNPKKSLSLLRISSFLSKQKAGTFLCAPPWAARSKSLSTRNAACFPRDSPLSIWPDCLGLGNPVKGTGDIPRLKVSDPLDSKGSRCEGSEHLQEAGPGSSWSPRAWPSHLCSHVFKASAVASRPLGPQQTPCLS